MGKSSCRPSGCLAFALLVALSGAGAQAGSPEKKSAEQAEIERLRAENKALLQLLQKREKEILKLSEENARARVERVQAATERELALKRIESLVERVRELERAVAGARAGKVSDQPNPPPGQVRGSVQKVTARPKDATLVQISIGKDVGLAVGHTLEVYRLEPRPEYLGMIRIVDVAAGTAVGALVAPAPGGPQPEVRPGDRVVGRIQP